MRFIELIPARRLEYEPPGLCHFEAIAAIPAAIAAIAPETGAAAATTAAAAEGFGGLAAASSVGGAIGTTALASALTPSLAGIGTAAAIGGTALGAASAINQGNYQQELSQVENQNLQQKANQDTAAAERQQVQEQRTTQLALSRAQAASAAEGGSASDTGVVNLDRRIAQQGTYNALSALYGGQAKALADRYQGQIDLFQGNQAASAAPLTALGRVLAGVGSLTGRLSNRTALGFAANTGTPPYGVPQIGS